MKVICPACATEMLSEEPISGGQRVECFYCHCKFEYSGFEQTHLAEIKRQVLNEVDEEFRQREWNEFQKKVRARARHQAKYKNSCFPECLRTSIFCLALGFAVTCIMYFQYIHFESPGWIYFAALSGCIVFPMLSIPVILDDDTKGIREWKRHKVRSIVALASCVALISTPFIQVLRKVSILPFGQAMGLHAENHLNYVSKEREKDLKEEESKIRLEHKEAWDRAHGWSRDSGYVPLTDYIVKEQANGRLRSNGKNYDTCPECLYSSTEGKRMSIKEFCAKEEYETDETIFKWMFWIGNILAIIGYIAAWNCRRRELLLSALPDSITNE